MASSTPVPAMRLDPDDIEAVALRVAEWVTMMHDGKVIVEGTPAEIRANELVHDLYLGSAHH